MIDGLINLSHNLGRSSLLNSSNFSVYLKIFIIKCWGRVKCPSVSVIRPTSLFFDDSLSLSWWRTLHSTNPRGCLVPC